MRLRHARDAEETVAFSPSVIQEPEQYRGTWSQVFGGSHPLKVEVGIGKGRSIMEKVSANSDINYTGIECYSSVPLRGLQKRSGVDLENICFMCIDAKDMVEILVPGGVGRICLDFSDPWSENRHTKRRLTSPIFMSVYDRILAPQGAVEFRTDNRGLFGCSLESIPNAGWGITEYTLGLHSSLMAEGNVMTEYEVKFTSEGKPICKLTARWTGILGQDPAQNTGKGYHQEVDSMTPPSGITRKLLQVIGDKTDLNKQALRFNRSSKEVGRLLGSGSIKVKKDKDKKQPPKREHTCSCLLLTGTGSRGRRDSKRNHS